MTDFYIQILYETMGDCDVTVEDVCYLSSHLSAEI